jgi:hypothetical protein
MKFKYDSFAILLAAFFSLRCSESLPVYQEPQKILDCSVSYEAPSPILFGHVEENAPKRIYLSSTTTKIFVSVVNIFDETIQDEIPKDLVFGYIEIWHPNVPGMYRKIQISSGDLFTRGVYDVDTRTLTIDPNNMVKFQVYWDYKDSSNTYVFMGMPIADEYNSGGYYTRILKPVPFRVRATVQLYSRLAPIRSPEFEMILNFEGRISIPP